MEISNKKTVKIHYTGTLSDGTVFDSSEGKEPLEFIQGIGMVIPGLEEGIKGLKTGDKKKFEIKSEKAYGSKMEGAFQELPKSNMPENVELKVGMQLAAQGPQGVIPVVISEIKDDTVIIDFNHPLAGKDLTFEVDIVEVKDTEPEKLKMIEKQMSGKEKSCNGGSCNSDNEKKDGCCGGNCHN